MLHPYFKTLEMLSSTGQGVFLSGTNLHPRPTYYKYDWLVFHEGSDCEGAAFMDYSKAISTSAAMTLVEELKREGKSCILYNRRRRRQPSAQTPPWPVGQGYEYAPGFDDDEDPEWQGHK